VPSPGTPAHRNRDRHRAVGFLAVAVLLVAALGACSSGDDDGAEPARAEGGQPAVGVKADGLIAFRRFFDDAQTEGAVFTIRPDGTGERQLTHPPRGHVDSQPAISPDGARIAFERCAEGKPCHVFLMNSDGSDQRRLDVSCTLKPICDDSAPAWGPNGELVINLASGREKTGGFGGQIQRSEIVIVDLEKGTQRSVARMGAWQADVGQPVWSPDGRQIAYVQLWSPLSKRQGIALHAVSTGGGRSRQITPYKLAAGDHPDWSPDGRWLIFRTDADQEDSPSELSLVHPDGSGLRHFDTPGDTVLSASFSPDGDWVVYSAPGRGGAFDLYVMRSDGTGNRPLTRATKWDSAPEWGP
jgi:TolB protein